MKNFPNINIIFRIFFFRISFTFMMRFFFFKNTNIIIQLNNISKAQYKNILFTDTYLCIIGPKAKEAVAAKPNIIPTILIALVRFSQCTLLEIQEYPTAIIAPLPCRALATINK